MLSKQAGTASNSGSVGGRDHETRGPPVTQLALSKDILGNRSYTHTRTHTRARARTHTFTAPLSQLPAGAAGFTKSIHSTSEFPLFRTDGRIKSSPEDAGSGGIVRKRSPTSWPRTNGTRGNHIQQHHYGKDHRGGPTVDHNPLRR